MYKLQRWHNIARLYLKQGRKRPLDTPKRMIERREREGEWEKERYKERYREGGRERERERGKRRAEQTQPFPQIMGRARIKMGEGRARFPLWEENPRELCVGIIRGLSVGIMRKRERERERGERRAE